MKEMLRRGLRAVDDLLDEGVALGMGNDADLDRIVGKRRSRGAEQGAHRHGHGCLEFH